MGLADSVGFKPDNHSLFKELALFQDYHGLPAFKNVSYPQMFRQRRKTVAAKIRGVNEALLFEPNRWCSTETIATGKYASPSSSLSAIAIHGSIWSGFGGEFQSQNEMGNFQLGSGMVNPNSYIRSNIDGFVNLLEVVKSSIAQPTINWASSSSVYGLNSKSRPSILMNFDEYDFEFKFINYVNMILNSRSGFDSPLNTNFSN
ncbi:hypothetical protein LXL04_006225 [Taraxacum kok-saghyz]